MIGVAAIVVVLIVVPDGHQSFSFVFGHRINNSGFSDGMYWFYVLPLGFLLTQYTITGFDASAHISEETHGAAESAAKGVWKSIFYSALIGWIVLLAITFAVTNVDGANEALGFAPTLLVEALGSGWGKFVLIISVVGQLFCGAACLTSASRMCYAFSRDKGFGHRVSGEISRVNSERVPIYAVLAMAIAALIITLPALKGNGENVPFAFFAVVSITVIGLYIAYVIPIFLRWRKGDDFEPGPWNNGRKYKWMNLVRDLLGRPDHDHLLPPVHPAGGALERRIQLGGVQLRAADGGRRDPARLDRLDDHRPQALHRPGAGDRPRERDRSRARGRPGPRRERGGVTFRGVTVEELKKAVADGTVDTVLLAIADMEGRLQGKRLTATPLPRRRARARGRGLQLPARGRRRHGNGRRLRDGLLGHRLRRLRDGARTWRRCGWCRGCRGRRC